MTLKTGLEPGSLIYVGPKRTHVCAIDIWRFNHQEAIHHELSQENSKYFRDLYDHILHETDNIHNLNEELDALMDIYHGNLSQKTNDTMRTLTVVSSIFVPLTFIVGVYGMNFENMPELQWENGYVYVWGLMLAVAVGTLFFSIRKKWL